MIKTKELSDPNSCFNRAADDEMIFVLLGRDVAAPAIIRIWAEERVRLGKNRLDDPQIVDALICADIMEKREAMAERGGNSASLNKAIHSTFPDPAKVLHHIDPLDNIMIEGLPLSLNEGVLQVLKSFQRDTINVLADCLVREAGRLESVNGFVTSAGLKRQAQALRDYAETLAPAAPEVNR